MSDLTTHFVNAIMFLPTGLPIDGMEAVLALAHIERRGYRLYTILRSWADVLKVLGNQEATVVVFADKAHFDPQWEPRVEFVGQETIRMVAGKPARPGDTTSRRPRRVED